MAPLHDQTKKILDFPRPLSVVFFNNNILFYILEHYDTACTNQKSAEDKSQKSTAEIAKMRNMMQKFVTQTAH